MKTIELPTGLVIAIGVRPDSLSMSFRGKLIGYLIHMTPGLKSELLFEIDGIQCRFIPFDVDEMTFIPTGKLEEAWR